MELIAILISLISFVLSLVSYIAQKNLQTLFFSRQSSEFLAQTVFELDKIYINDPSLWSLYDSRSNQSQKDGCLRALGLYYLNMFQMAYDLYQDSNPRNDKRSARLWAGWDIWLKDFLRSSSLTRLVWQENRNSYEENFRKYVDKVLEEITKSNQIIQ